MLDNFGGNISRARVRVEQVVALNIMQCFLHGSFHRVYVRDLRHFSPYGLPNGYITCVVAGLDSASDADTSEAGIMSLEAADSTTSGACFVGRIII
jgi:hypothetical protein